MDNCQGIRCHLEGHLNSPITKDEVDFLLRYQQKEFLCLRHRQLSNLFKTNYPHLRSFEQINHCPWLVLEEVINSINVESVNLISDSDLVYLSEAATWNTEIHHQSYYGIEMDISKDLNLIKQIMRDSQNQILFKMKEKVEYIKSELTEREQILGHFHKISDDLLVEKELTLVQYQNKFYLFPTTMLMCTLDNIQVRFYLRVHISHKEISEGISGLLHHYDNLHQLILFLKMKYRNHFFDLMKNWDAYVIGHVVSDTIEDMGFTKLRDTLESELKETFELQDLRAFLDLISCRFLEKNRDQASYVALYLANLCKNYGHPILGPIDGIKQLRENSKKKIDVDDNLAKKVLWKFRETYSYSFYRKRGHYPNHQLTGPISETLKTCIIDNRLPMKKECEEIPLHDWENFHLKKNHELSLEIDEKELLKDTACAPPREEWFIPYDPCAFKFLYGQRKPRASGSYEPRVLARYLKGEEGELAAKISNQESLHYNHNRDDIVQLCRKERELNVLGRVFCKQTYEMRLMQVCLEKSLSDNILPLIREQTMTSSELEVAKRMDKIASSIANTGEYNINLDLSKWNQLQRHALNKYLFNELDELHGRSNLYADSHLWFNRCMVLLSSRLTPPEIGFSGEPLEGDFCHYDQEGGFEGMRQKAWTLTTIMVIKLALQECGLVGETMGQGDNQVIHLKLKGYQTAEPQKHIKLLLNTLDHLFSIGGLKLKLSETWYSKNLFEYSKVRYFKSLRVDDSLKKLNRMIPDINEGFPSLQSLVTGVATTTENLSRSCLSPCLPMFFYSLETGNVFRRKKLIDASESKISLPVLLNCPSVFGGLPLSNIYQHCQRGCPDPLTIWLKIWFVIRNVSPEVFQALLHVLPCEIKQPMDPIRLVEDMYSLNISGLPNFERKAREIVESFLPGYVTNPQVIKLLGASREDLTTLCELLITMRPYIANLAHEILRNSNEGIQLQLIGSFTNVQTINRIINETSTESETIFHLGLLKDKEAVSILRRRLRSAKLPIQYHLIHEIMSQEICTFVIAYELRKRTWGFEITGITSPVPCEQTQIQDYDTTHPTQRGDCIVAKVSHSLKTDGKKAFQTRGPYPPYLGSSTPEKMTKPRLTVASPNPTVKSVMKLYYILTYLERMDRESPLIGLIRRMIDDKLKSLPKVFHDTPLEDWCGKNYGGSYEHRFKASSQKRSALFALTTNLATHININTNQLGKALRGNEDYNIFFQELFLFIQNYISELAYHNYPVWDTFAILLACGKCTYQIINQPISMNKSALDYRSRMMIALPDSKINTFDLTHCVRICILAMSVSVGRKLSFSRSYDLDSHNVLEAYGNVKTDEITERLSSNLMSEFRGADFNYVLVGCLQGSRQFYDYILSRTQDYPKDLLEHLAYLILNSDRLSEISTLLELKIGKHSEVTQVKSLARLLALSLKDYLLDNLNVFWTAATFTVFKSDSIYQQAYYWRTFLCYLIRISQNYTKTQLAGILRIPTIKGETIFEWNKILASDHSQNLGVRIPFDENDSISVWRDLKGQLNELVGPFLPLSEKIQRNFSKGSLSQEQSPDIKLRSTSLSFTFSPRNINPQGSVICPIWIRYIHHTTRTLGRISTAASKILDVLSYYTLQRNQTNLVITLAEGSGSILAALSHLYPTDFLLYNTLQNDTVEIKDNFLNITPPSLVGDRCNPTERLIHLSDLCIGETDITTPIFTEKLLHVLETCKSEIDIFTMDAELKTDITNFDKLQICVPLIVSFLEKNGLIINKMFCFSQVFAEELSAFCYKNKLGFNIHKPPSSHPHNHEVYVVMFRLDSHHSEFSGIAGEKEVFSYLIKEDAVQIPKIPLLSSFENRIQYLRYLTHVSLHGPLTDIRNHPCLDAIKSNYSLNEITIHFLSRAHQKNLIGSLINLETNEGLVKIPEILPFVPPFLSKIKLCSLLTLSLLMSLCKTVQERVSALDTLSSLKLNCNIIPGKRIEVSFIPVINPNEGQDSVIGVIDQDMKDFFRTLPYFLKNSRGVPCIVPRTLIKRLSEIETLRTLFLQDIQILRSSGPSGFRSFIKLER